MTSVVTVLRTFPKARLTPLRYTILGNGALLFVCFILFFTMCLNFLFTQAHPPPLYAGASSSLSPLSQTICFSIVKTFGTEKKGSHWLKQWPIRKGLGDKKRRSCHWL